MRKQNTPVQAIPQSGGRRKKKWLTVMSVLAALVVFVTTYALTMPATTLEWDDSQTETTETTETAETTEAAEETAAALPEGAQVPEGYTQQYTAQDEDSGLAVTVYAPEGVVPEGAALSAALLNESDDAYTAAETALLTESAQTLSDDEESSYGFAALDIHFEDAQGNEVEPDGQVYVVLDAAGLLPESADSDTITIQHHVESAEGVTVETVADAAGETDGVVAVTDSTTLQTAFAVDSFSTFTISWSSYFTVTVHYVDENGNEIQGTQTQTVNISNNTTRTFADYAGNIDGYTYSAAHYGSYTGSVVTTVTASQQTIYGSTTRYLTFYNGSSQVGRLSKGDWDWPQTVNVYLVYTKDTEESASSITVTTGKTAELREDGDYDLTLSISGDRGSETTKVAVNVLFILDNSGSMDYSLYRDSNAAWNENSRMDLLKDAVNTLVTTIEGNDSIEAQYAAVGFAGARQTTTQSWTNASTISSYVNNLNANGGTNYQAGIYRAKQLLNSARKDAITFVVFVSDGIPTYRGTTSDTGTGNSDDYGYNINDAVTEISSMSCNYFYAIGMGPTFTQGGTGMTNLNSLASAVKASDGTGVYSATDEDSFTKAFEDITSSITFFAASDVTITDPLSNYADIVLDEDGNAQFTITVTNETTTWTNNGSGNTLTFKDADDNDVTVTASYNSSTKTITLDFPDVYALEEGYTYSVSTVITPSETAVKVVENSGNYNAIGDANTGTHANNTGFYSNGNAEVTYTTTNGESGSAAFPKPVIQVSISVEPDFHKYVKDNQDGTYDLSLDVTGENVTVGSEIKADIIFILDKSGSMDYKLDADSTASGNEQSRMDLLQEAVESLVSTIEENTSIDARYAAVGFSGDGTSNHGSTTTQTWTNSSALLTYVNSLTPDGGTNYQRAIYEAKQLLNNTREGAMTFVIFVSDGEPTFRGTSSDSGTGSNDTDSANINAAVAEIKTMSCNYFYAIGMGPSFTQGGTSMTNLNSLADAVQASNTGVYSARNTEELQKAFSDIATTITSSSIGNVTITDQLSKYAQLVKEDAVPTITITNANGDTVAEVTSPYSLTEVKDEDGNVTGYTGEYTFTENNERITLTYTYDIATKTFTLSFPEDYQLTQGWTYTITVEIEPTDEAINYSPTADDTTNRSGYPHIGDEDTDAPGNTTSSEKPGFYCNTEASLTYNDGEKEEYPMPVIQVNAVDLPFEKVDSANTTNLSGAQFVLYQYQEQEVTEDGETTTQQVKVYYTVTTVTTTEGAEESTVSWQTDLAKAYRFTSAETTGCFTLENLTIGQTYYLSEVVAPTGYNLPANDITISWKGSAPYIVMGNTLVQDGDGDGFYEITNTTGQELPATGGTGTILFTIGGLLLIAAAVGGGYVLRRRRGREGN